MIGSRHMTVGHDMNKVIERNIFSNEMMLRLTYVINWYKITKRRIKLICSDGLMKPRFMYRLIVSGKV